MAASPSLSPFERPLPSLPPRDASPVSIGKDGYQSNDEDDPKPGRHSDPFPWKRADSTASRPVFATRSRSGGALPPDFGESALLRFGVTVASSAAFRLAHFLVYEVLEADDPPPEPCVLAREEATDRPFRSWDFPSEDCEVFTEFIDNWNPLVIVSVSTNSSNIAFEPKARSRVSSLGDGWKSNGTSPGRAL